MFEQATATATSEAITAAPAVKAAASVKINAIAFGDKGALARTLTSKGAEKTASVLAAALMPVASNRAIGHGTFKTLVTTGSPDKGNTCPLQAAIAGLKGKAAQARHAVFSLVKACHTQEQHDALMLECETALMVALAPAPKAASEAPTVTPTVLKAQLATVTAERDALALEVKALKAALKAANVAQPARTTAAA